MVGIVVVSHSRALARAALTLAKEMLHDQPVSIVIAAGLDDETLGTDAQQIHDALVEADDGDGVVVLMDLGSAVLSAELALEFLADDEARQRVLLCPAPLVEGLVVAAVTAASGAGRGEVAAEALGALAGKQSQLSPGIAAPTEAASATGWLTDVLTITPMHGLHARPAARLVQVLQGLDARVELRNPTTGSGWVPGASLSRLATLGARHGHQVEIRATGRQAEEAISRIGQLSDRNFDETDQQKGIFPTPDDDAGPLPAAPGIGIGPARHHDGRTVRALRPRTETASNDTETSDTEPPDERARLDTAISTVRAHLTTLRAQVAQTSESAAGIFDAHLALLDDPELAAVARTRVEAGELASTAWADVVERAAAGLHALTDPYLRARAADVRDVGDQVQHHLLDDPATSPDVPPDRRPTEDGTIEQGVIEDGTSKDGTSKDDDPQSPGVLVAADLTPAEAATLDPKQVIAVVLAFGSPTAHSAILARARGIPTVVGAGPSVLQITEGTLIAVDGTTGTLAVDPSPLLLNDFRERAESARARRQAARDRSTAPAITRDGVEILVGANIGAVEEAAEAAAAGADLIGLVRTEFLFLHRDRAPDVDEQEAVYRAIAGAFPGRRITFRTLDVGGDKPLPYLPSTAAEENPFLGLRGLRLSLRHPALLAEQLLAIVRVAHDVPVSVMFPMVSTLDELTRARRLLATAIDQVGRGAPDQLQVGIMVEVPATALKAAAFAEQVDFLSLGTNDLTQYALAAERGNPTVAAIADPFDPGVLRLIDAAARGAAAREAAPRDATRGTTPRDTATRGADVSDTLLAVCGELAADERATGLLIGLGVRELSVTPRAVPLVKQAVRELLLSESQALANRALHAPSAAIVHALLDQPPNDSS